MEKKNENMQEVMDLLLEELYSRISTRTIGDVKYDISRYCKVDCTDEYDDFSISEFLILYKIAYLESHNLIDEETSTTLKFLFAKKSRIEKDYGELAIKGLSRLTPEEKVQMQNLYEELIQIEAIFKTHHLISDEEELLDTLVARLNQREENKEDNITPTQK